MTYRVTRFTPTRCQCHGDACHPCEQTKLNEYAWVGVEPWLPDGRTKDQPSPYFDYAQYDIGCLHEHYGYPFRHVILTKEGSKQEECFPLPYNLFTLSCLDTRKLQRRSSPTEPYPPALKDQRKSSETGFKTILLLIDFLLVIVLKTLRGFL